MFIALGLGSNREFASIDSIHLLAQALSLLKEGLSDFTFSSVYRTKPMYVEDQSDFYNMAACGNTEKSPSDFLAFIHKIEERLGRKRECEIRNGPRSIDIDIELYGNEEISFQDSENPMNNLEIPHPRLAERAFVLIPLLEILPDNADIKKRDFYRESLAKIGNQGAEKCLSSLDFEKVLSEVDYGRADKGRKSGSN
ncbi:MAG: 2-amino-4-hydroxy-6-hydroxymethyldihydropteridine diphosphokinase [Treponema sp.]|nr:2-amino-4-hydroxy-6-hydroxymethyldihydropteridine diphosphokinase [Treponema sp.]